MLVDLLEGESGTISSEIPTVVMGSLMPLNSAAAGALKVSEVITIATDNNGHTRNTIPQVGDLVAGGRCSTHGLSEGKSQESNACHWGEDKTEKAHILSLCTLLL